MNSSSGAPLAEFHTACAAPFTTLHLDPRGVARVCCENKMYRIGQVPDQRLIDIWQGAALDALRNAMRADDLALGCDGCADAIAAGRRNTVRAGLYDWLAVSEVAPSGPQVLELELSNRCNLQCAMCNGELSSAIRTHREGRPPLPKVYGDEFFEEVAALVPTLRHVSFFGGEPFLGPESLRVFEILIAHGYTGRVHVTTNGTIRTRRVEEFLERLDVDVSISIDGFSAGTLERIRVGVDHADLHRNVAWFRETARRRSTTLSIHYCLMRDNWSELRDFLSWADGIDVDVLVLRLRHPIAMSLAHLDPSQLSEVVATLRHQEASGPSLGRNQAAWDDMLWWLESLGAKRDAGAPVAVTISASPGGVVVPGLGAAPQVGPVDENAVAHIIDELRSWADSRGVHVLEFDREGQFLGATPDPADIFGVDLRGYVGSHMRELMEPTTRAIGVVVGSTELATVAGCEERLLFLQADDGPVTLRSVYVVASADGLTRVHVGARPGPAEAGAT